MPAECIFHFISVSRERYSVKFIYTFERRASSLPSDINRAMREALESRTARDTDSYAFCISHIRPTRGVLRYSNILQMEDLSLSVVIPAYNAVNTIDATLKCMHSELEKAVARFPQFSYELIVIDDGSTDGTREKVTAMNLKGLRLLSKKNTGVSDTRNFGLSRAKNKYVWYFDADDLLFNDSVIRIVEFLLREPDILKVSSVTEDRKTKSQINEYNNSASARITFEGPYADFLCNHIVGFSACIIIFRRELIISSDISFDNDMTISEDVMWNIRLAILNPNARAVVTNLNVVRYIVHDSSAVNTSSTIKNERHLDSSIKFLAFMDRELPGVPFMQHSFDTYRLNTINQIITRFLSCSFKDPKLKKRIAETLAIINTSSINGMRVRVFRTLSASPTAMRVAQFFYRHIFIPYIKPHLGRN